MPMNIMRSIAIKHALITTARFGPVCQYGQAGYFVYICVDDVWLNILTTKRQSHSVCSPISQ
jgi:hypothetical protein